MESQYGPFKIYSPYDPVIPLLGIHPRKVKLTYKKAICISIFTEEQPTIAKT